MARGCVILNPADEQFDYYSFAALQFHYNTLSICLSMEYKALVPQYLFQFSNSEYLKGHTFEVLV